MMKQPKSEYHPDYVIPPGETIQELMEEHDLSEHLLARDLGCTQAELSALLRGERELTQKMADRLEQRFRVPARFWMNLEANYRRHRERQP